MAEGKAIDGQPTGDVQTSEKPRGAGGPKPGMSAAERALRDAAIIEAAHAGETGKDIAARFGITRRQVERIKEGFALRETALNRRPMEIIERVLRTYERQMADFAAVAHDSIGRNPSVALGALKAQADALERYWMLLADVGKLPDNLELFRTEMEQRRFGDLMLSKIKQVEDGEITLADLSAFFDLLKRPTTPLFDVEGEARELEPGEEAA